MSSSYPVRPRKGTKLQSGNKALPGFSEGNSRVEFADRKAAEGALSFITRVKSIHRDLYDLEIRREQFEYVQASYEQSFQNISRDYRQNKEEQENYIRVLQSLYIRALKLHSLYSRRISILYDLYDALQNRRIAIDTFNNNIESLKSAMQSQPKGTNKLKQKFDTFSTLSIVDVETNMLKVNLVKSKRSTVLYKGQRIITPMGEGYIIFIFPNSLKVTIKLAFGILYSNISRVAIWSNRDEIIDAASSKALYAKWTSLKQRISLSEINQNKINELISDDVEAQSATDKESDASDDISLKHNDDDNNNNSQVQEKDTQSNIFPIILTNTKYFKEAKKSACLREVIKNKLGYDSFLPDRLSNPLPLAFTPTNTLSCLLQDFFDTQESKLNICYESLVSEEDESCNASKTASLTCTGDLPKMRSAMKAIIEEVNEAESQQRYNLDQIQTVRTKMCNLSTETSLIRLGMHNRRVHHQAFMKKNGLKVTSFDSDFQAGKDVLDKSNRVENNGLVDNSSLSYVDDREEAISNLMDAATKGDDDINTANIMTSMLNTNRPLNKRLQSQISIKSENIRESRSGRDGAIEEIGETDSDNKGIDGNDNDAKNMGLIQRKKPKRGGRR